MKRLEIVGGIELSAGSQMTADEWNKEYRPGMPVLVKLDDGRLWQTATRSTAWELGGGQPVVLLHGRSGGYDLSRVRPHTIQETPLA